MRYINRLFSANCRHGKPPPITAVERSRSVLRSSLGDSSCLIPDPGTGSAVGHHDLTWFFNGPVLDRALQPKDDPFRGPWSARTWMSGVGSKVSASATA